MKKIIAVLLTCVLLVTVVTACSSHSHVATGIWMADAVGHWKSCDECDEKTEVVDHTLGDDSRCTVCNSEVMDWGDSISVYTFDEYDTIVRMAEYGTDNNLITETVNDYVYDSNGNVLSVKEYVDGRLNSELECAVIDGESVDKLYTYYNEDGSKFINEYDDNGNVIKLVDYDSDGNITFESLSEYTQTDDGEWYESKCTENYNDGMKIEATYNDRNDNLTRVIYDAEGNITASERWEYTYDGDKTASVKEYSDDILITETVYKYVTDGDGGTYGFPETVTTYNEDCSKTVCVYDENDEVVSETSYDASGNVIE